MPYRWPDDTVFTDLELNVEEPWCQTCGGRLTVCDHRHRRLFTLHGPVHVVCKLVHCPHQVCPAHTRTISPAAETALALPWWVLGWDVVCWLGQRRFARHWAVAQLRAELADTYQIRVSDDAIERYLHRYQHMLAARQQDPWQLAAAYAGVDAISLAIDGLQPEKGHETLYVVRELTQKRVWFAEALLSSATAEVQQLLARARRWAEQLGTPVRLWMSDKQHAFVRGIAAEFPGVPHRYCANHFLRDTAKPVLEADSRAKVQMRRKVRGLRVIERRVLEAHRPTAPPEPTPSDERSKTDAPPLVAAAVAAAPWTPSDRGLPTTDSAVEATGVATTEEALVKAEAGEVVLGYCAAVRGILHDSQGGPLHPPGLRMREALQDVRDSLERNLQAKKGGLQSRC